MLQKILEIIRKYANKKRIKGLILQKGDKVYLQQTNIKTRRLSKKLDYKKLGLFIIKEKLSELNYKLDLPKGIRIYLVFYILLLESVLKDTPIKEKEEVDEEDKQEVERILDIRKDDDGTVSFLVKQKDYNYNDNLQEIQDNIKKVD